MHSSLHLSFLRKQTLYDRVPGPVTAEARLVLPGLCIAEHQSGFAAGRRHSLQ